ncbi:NAD-dependent epimerase/dehydratase family protein [Sphingobacterium siyangense]|uniref:NAD-dependent epimerase/dehydratase family protein n=1 Tax=Sphingobacterium siyangense TaxID=459529 RepID=UPI003DA5BC94
MKILICGHNSFAAKNIVEKLMGEGHEVDCFTRGEEGREGHEVRGSVYGMQENPHLQQHYDVLINYILIKNEGAEQNLQYIKSLHDYCNKYVNTLIHVSSISVYPNDAEFVNELSPIETDRYKKGSYAAVKLSIDNYLVDQEKKYNLVFLRPGFVVEQGMSFSNAGICINLPFNISLLLGDKYTSLPLIDRDRMNDAIVRIVASQDRLPCYLLSENRRGTKYQYLKANKESGLVIGLPSKLVLGLSSLLSKIGLLDKRRFHQIEGLFKKTIFESTITEEKLGLSMTRNSICVVGSGVYGSYTIDAIRNKYPDTKLTLIEVGDKSIKNEEDIGYVTKMLSSHYTGLSDGRYFGFGGTSNKWGGQILLFSDKDFESPGRFLSELIRISEQYKVRIFKKFGITDISQERSLNPQYPLFIKTGVWLGYFSRNLYRYFRLHKEARLITLQNTRLIEFIHEGKRVTGARIYVQGQVRNVYYDQFVLCAGAFESNRVLLQSGLLVQEQIPFSDHLSKKVFKIKGKPKIGLEDFQFKVSGSSLITKRLIGEVNGYSYFANPIYNANFPFFSNLKKVLFKGQWNFGMLKDILMDIPSVVKFGVFMFFKKRVYVYRDEWFLYIDIENPVGESFVKLSETVDKFGIKGLDVSFDINHEQVTNIYNQAIAEVRKLLEYNAVVFQQQQDLVSADKLEDTYHPYAMALSDSRDLNDYFTRFDNLLVLNTGILPRAGGINTTAALFPIIEYYVDNILFKK